MVLSWLFSKQAKAAGGPAALDAVRPPVDQKLGWSPEAVAQFLPPRRTAFPEDFSKPAEGAFFRQVFQGAYTFTIAGHWPVATRLGICHEAIDSFDRPKIAGFISEATRLTTRAAGIDVPEPVLSCMRKVPARREKKFAGMTRKESPRYGFHFSTTLRDPHDDDGYAHYFFIFSPDFAATVDHKRQSNGFGTY